MTVISVEWQTWKLSTEPFPSLYITVSLDDFQYRHRKWRTTYQLPKGFPLLIFMQGVFQVTFGWFVSYHCLSHASLWVGEAMNFFVFWYGNLLWKKKLPCGIQFLQIHVRTEYGRRTEKQSPSGTVKRVLKEKINIDWTCQDSILWQLGFGMCYGLAVIKQSRCPCR